jgi:predicted phage terminase large subunit-like protein
VKYVLWRIGRDPNLRVVVISRTGALAASINREVRRNIDNNERYRRVFPEIQADSPWGDEAFQVKRKAIMKSPTFYGTGLEGSVTGIRGDLLILDDPFDLNEVRTEASREKVRSWIDSVTISILPPDGELVSIGTRWHEDDYWGTTLGKSVENGGDWVCKVYRAIENYDDPPEKWRVLWPERWSAEALEKRQRDVGSLMFRSLYQNDPYGLKGALFKEEWLTYYDPKIFAETHPKYFVFFMAVDPAISEDPEADQTAIVTIAFDLRTSDIYVINIWTGRINFPKQVKKIIEYAKRRRLPGFPFPKGVSITKIGIESVAYQKALYSSLYNKNLPVVEVKTGIRSKLERMLGLQPNFENGRIKFPKGNITYNWIDKFMSEYLSYPRGKHDDILDSLEIAVKLTQEEVFGESSMSKWIGGRR